MGAFLNASESTHVVEYDRKTQTATEYRGDEVVAVTSFAYLAWDVAQRIASDNAYQLGARFTVYPR